MSILVSVEFEWPLTSSALRRVLTPFERYITLCSKGIIVILVFSLGECWHTVNPQGFSFGQVLATHAQARTITALVLL